MMTQASQPTKRDSWELQLTQQELEQLRRERDHLNSKAIERPLTTWEKLRQQEIFEEVSALLKRAKSLSERIGGGPRTTVH